VTALGRTRLTSLLLAGLAFAVYLTNLRPMGPGDTIPARLLPFSLLREGNLDLDEFGWLRPNGFVPYFLVHDAAGHWRSKYPVATPLLVTPLAWPAVWWARAGGIDDSDARFRLLTAVFERVAAALLAAAAVGIVFLAARELAPPGWAAAAALLFAFGTTTWATSSQALWQHGVAEIGIAGASLCLLRPPGTRRAFLAGAFTTLSISARPTTGLFAVVIAFYLWRERRADLTYFLALPVVGTGLLIAYNISALSQATGGYTGRGLRLPSLERLAGVLISPSRGLFIYCPLAALAFAALRATTRPPLLRYLAAAVLAYVLFYAGFLAWWGGHSYGPRYCSDFLPLMALCAIPVAQRMWASTDGRVALTIGALWCIGVQVIGVYCDDNGWNEVPGNIDVQTERLWDWSDPQILRAARAGWHGADFATLLHQLLVDPRPAPLVPLDPADLSGTIEAAAPPPWRFTAGRGGALDVHVTNRSAARVWPAYSDYGALDVGLVLVWRSGDAVQQGIGGFVPLRRNLGPAESEHFRTWVDAPPTPGAYKLEIAIVQDLGRSGRFGGAALTVPVIVE